MRFKNATSMKFKLKEHRLCSTKRDQECVRYACKIEWYVVGNKAYFSTLVRRKHSCVFDLQVI